LQSPAVRSAWRRCWMFSCLPHVIGLLGPGSLCRCCIPVPLNVSSWMSVLSRFLLKHCLCLVPDDRDHCAVQERQGGSSSVGGGQLLPGPTVVLGPFLRLSAMPYC
jgi:hypothetical protein